MWCPDSIEHRDVPRAARGSQQKWRSCMSVAFYMSLDDLDIW